MLVNAGLYAATIALLCHLITRELPKAESIAAVGLVTLIGIAPFDWQIHYVVFNHKIIMRCYFHPRGFWVD